MPLRLRRGTDAERLTITPAEGELIYTTDEKRIYVGDGTTLGGVALIADTSIETLAVDLDLNGFDIFGTGNININGNITATGDIDGNFIGTFDGDIRGSVFSDDSTLLVDGLTGNHYGLFNGNVIGNVTGGLFGNVTGNVLGNVTGNVTGNVLGNVTGNLNGNVNGDVKGSLFGDDSSLLVDGLTGKHYGLFNGDLNGTVTGNLIGNVLGNLKGNVSGNIDGNFVGSVFSDNSTLIIDGLNGNVHTNNVVSSTGNFKIDSQTPGVNQVKIIADNGRSILKLSRGSAGNLAGGSARYGAVFFERDDINGPLTTSAITAGENFLHIIATLTGNLNDLASTLAWANKRLGVGTTSPNATLDVRGDGIFVGNISVNGSGTFIGTVNAASFKGSVVGDDSTVIVDAINSTIAVSGTATAGRFSAGDGSATDPSITFTTDGAVDTGLYHPGDGIIAVTTNGTETARFDSGGFRTTGFSKVGSFNGGGAYPSPAEAGMIIFDSSDNHFYGYNGSVWKQLDN